MTDEERERFLPATRTFVSVLEKPNLDQREIDQLIKESEALSVLIPESMREVISSSLSNLISARSGWKLSYIYTILHWYDINAYINYTSCHTINNIKTNVPMKIWLIFLLLEKLWCSIALIVGAYHNITEKVLLLQQKQELKRDFSVWNKQVNTLINYEKNILSTFVYHLQGLSTRFDILWRTRRPTKNSFWVKMKISEV